ncbi:MAG: (d)CMP kinase [Bdellovibrionaceae bacterium]|jgi:cytidylate kinase|nr:(d)CMP kinase [Pseudobdellovibrionaceae bacterium]
MAEVLKLITIDGTSASGKSSLSRRLAQALGWNWLSTGVFYRGLAYVALREAIDLDDVSGLVALAHNHDLWSVRMRPEQTECCYRSQLVTNEILHEDVGAMASRVSKIPEVRAALLQGQRDCFDPQRGLIAEGRDCGTVVFPQAPLKFYLQADPEARAQRRALQEQKNTQEILRLQQARDQQDQSRLVAPLSMAKEAILIDSTYLSLDEVFAIAWEHVQRVFSLSHRND